MGLEPYLQRTKRGVGTLALALVWLTLAWRGTGRPERLSQLDDTWTLILRPPGDTT